MKKLSIKNRSGKSKDLNIIFNCVNNYNIIKKIKTAREEKIKGELITINPENIWESIS